MLLYGHSLSMHLFMRLANCSGWQFPFGSCCRRRLSITSDRDTGVSTLTCIKGGIVKGLRLRWVLWRDVRHSDFAFSCSVVALSTPSSCQLAMRRYGLGPEGLVLALRRLQLARRQPVSASRAPRARGVGYRRSSIVRRNMCIMCGGGGGDVALVWLHSGWIRHVCVRKWVAGCGARSGTTVLVSRLVLRLIAIHVASRHYRGESSPSGSWGVIIPHVPS